MTTEQLLKSILIPVEQILDDDLSDVRALMLAASINELHEQLKSGKPLPKAWEKEND